MIRRGLVERVPVRVSPGLGLVVAGTDDPLALGGERGLPPDAVVEFGEAGHAQVDLGQRETEPDHVVVRVPGQASHDPIRSHEKPRTLT
jgi:hypothetical protein